jgi:hypothetical protein
MKLYNLPRKSFFTLPEQPEEQYFFDHIDGMYSYCLNKEKEVIHFGASTEVEPVQ